MVVQARELIKQSESIPCHFRQKDLLLRKLSGTTPPPPLLGPYHAYGPRRPRLLLTCALSVGACLLCGRDRHAGLGGDGDQGPARLARAGVGPTGSPTGGQRAQALQPAHGQTDRQMEEGGAGGWPVLRGGARGCGVLLLQLRQLQSRVEAIGLKFPEGQTVTEVGQPDSQPDSRLRHTSPGRQAGADRPTHLAGPAARSLEAHVVPVLLVAVSVCVPVVQMLERSERWMSEAESALSASPDLKKLQVERDQGQGSTSAVPGCCC